MSEAQPLTARQREVLRLVGDGLTSRGIGGRLGLKMATVNYHVLRSCRQLGARNRSEAVVMALRVEVVAE